MMTREHIDNRKLLLKYIQQKLLLHLGISFVLEAMIYGRKIELLDEIRALGFQVTLT